MPFVLCNAPSTFQRLMELVVAGLKCEVCLAYLDDVSVVHLMYFTRHFRAYLLGRPFVARTDHSTLQWLQQFNEPQGQVARWFEQLQEFNFRLEHRPGRKHLNADALSRRPCRQCGKLHVEDSSVEARCQLCPQVGCPYGHLV